MAAVVQAEVVGAAAPPQQSMGGADYLGKGPITIKQKWSPMENFLGCEARNIYHVYDTASPQNGEMFINESSECLERLCCGPQRTLTFHVRLGNDKNAPEWFNMHKPFHLAGNWCCCRPKFDVKDANGAPIGTVNDPFACCVMNQKITDAADAPVYDVSATICQLGLCCPCFKVEYPVYRPGDHSEKIGAVYKEFDGCMELCCDTNKFKVDFPADANTQQKQLLLASAMLIDLQYFEEKEKNRGGGGDGVGF